MGSIYSTFAINNLISVPCWSERQVGHLAARKRVRSAVLQFFGIFAVAFHIFRPTGSFFSNEIMNKSQYSRCLDHNGCNCGVIKRWAGALILGSLIYFLSAPIEIHGQTKVEPNTTKTTELLRILAGGVDAKERAAAAQLLAQRGEQKAVKDLMRAANDPDGAVRLQAILALGQLRSRAAVPLLIEILTTATDTRERAAAAFALGIVRDGRAVGPLIEQMKTAGSPLVQNIIISLGRLGDPRAVEPLLALSHDDDHEACAPIALALGQVRSRIPAAKLFEWLNSDEGDVCPNAAIALVLIGGKTQVIPLIEVLKNRNPVSRRSAAFALGALRDRRAVLPLIETLKDTDKRVRLNAIAALSSMRDKRAVDPLSEAGKSDDDAEVRAEATAAIKRIYGMPER